MSNAQTDNSAFLHFAGVDLGRDSLTLTVIDRQGKECLKTKDFPTSKAGFRRLRKCLGAFPKLAVAFEPTGNPSLTFLKALDGFDAKLFQINGRVIRRRATSLTQTKTDAADAKAIAETVRDIAIAKPGELEHFRIVWNAEHANLALLATEYTERVEDVRRLKVRADHLEHQSAPMAVELRGRVAKDLKAAEKARDQAKQEMAAAAKACNGDMFALLLSIPGIGEVGAANLVREIGSISRFESADALKGFLGMYPARRQSGKTEYPAHLAKHGNSAVKSTLFMSGHVAARHNPTCKKLFDRLVGKGKKRIVAIGAVMRKLIQIVYGVLKNKTPFSPDFA